MRAITFVRISRMARPLIGCVAVFVSLALLCTTIIRPTTAAGVKDDSVQVPDATFPGTGAGAIPDSPGGTPPAYGTPLVISYAVTGVTAPLASVSVSITLTHSWVGDLDIVLAAPGGAPNQVVVGHIGAIAAGDFGDSSNYSGTYVFNDAATNTAMANIWSVATGTNGNPACADACAVTAGNYRTTARGGAGQTNPPPVTSLNTTFGGLTTGQINGTWTLTIRDGGGGDTGTVTASALTLTPTTPPLPPRSRTVDFDGDNKTDFAVMRANSATAQATWFIRTSAGVNLPQQDWGLGFGYWSNQVNLGDACTPADFDGDGKADIAVWRAGAAFSAGFYILQSSTGTLRTVQFGQTGDDPTVVDDYDGDGKVDPAVYRVGATGQPSFYFYQGSLNNPSGTITYIQWGVGGDFSAPGDYDGDGKADAAVYRPGGGGAAPQNAYYILKSSDGGSVYVPFGSGSSGLLSRGGTVKGDFDGDGKNDFAWIQRVAGGNLLWHIRGSLTGTTTVTTFGLQTVDLPVAGDYDGDNKTDIAVWRTGQAADQTFFYWRPSSGGSDQQAEWGQSAAALSVPDYPVAAFNFH